MTFEEFCRTRLEPLLRFAKVLCIDAGLAEDVVQEVLIRVGAQWDRIDGLDKPEAFVRRMIVNEFLSWRRKWARIIPLAVLPEAASVPDFTDQHAERDAIIARLAKLSRRQRAVIVLRYYGGLTDPEIAAELGCGESTVRAYASRAMTALRIDWHDSPVAQLKEG